MSCVDELQMDTEASHNSAPCLYTLQQSSCASNQRLRSHTEPLPSESSGHAERREGEGASLSIPLLPVAEALREARSRDQSLTLESA